MRGIIDILLSNIRINQKIRSFSPKLLNSLETQSTRRGQLQFVVHAGLVAVELGCTPTLPVAMSLEAVQHRDEDEVIAGLQFGHDGHEHVAVETSTTIGLCHDKREHGRITAAVEAGKQFGCIHKNL